MKVFAIFMTIIMLLTGVDVCKEASGCESGEKTELCKMEKDAHEPDHDQELPCAPFCHCARCPFSIMIPVQIANLNPIRLEGYNFNSILLGKPSDVSFSIWQPPKLA